MRKKAIIILITIIIFVAGCSNKKYDKSGEIKDIQSSDNNSSDYSNEEINISRIQLDLRNQDPGITINLRKANNNNSNIDGYNYRFKIINTINESSRIEDMTNFSADYIIEYGNMKIYCSRQGYLKYEDSYYQNKDLEDIYSSIFNSPKNLFYGVISNGGLLVNKIVFSYIVNENKLIDYAIEDEELIKDIVRAVIIDTTNLDSSKHHPENITTSISFKSDDEVLSEIKNGYITIESDGPKEILIDHYFNIWGNPSYIYSIYNNYIENLERFTKEARLISGKTNKGITLNKSELESIFQIIKDGQSQYTYYTNQRFPYYSIVLDLDNGLEININIMDKNLIYFSPFHLELRYGIRVDNSLWEIIENISPIDETNSIEKLFNAAILTLYKNPDTLIYNIEGPFLKNSVLNILMKGERVQGIPEEEMFEYCIEAILPDETLSIITIYDNYFSVDNDHYRLEEVREMIINYLMLF